MRVTILEFLDADVFSVSVENCVSFLDPLIESWDIDLVTFAMEIALSRRLASGDPKRFEYVEREAEQPYQEEPGLKEFLRNPAMSADAGEEEIEFLERLRFKGKRPTPLYYYREFQNLRDPLHFRLPLIQTPRRKTTGHSQPKGSIAPTHKHMEASRIEKQMQLDGREGATQRWAWNKGRRVKKEKTNS